MWQSHFSMDRRLIASSERLRIALPSDATDKSYASSMGDYRTLQL
jgi:hypothetical protein